MCHLPVTRSMRCDDLDCNPPHVVTYEEILRVFRVFVVNNSGSMRLIFARAVVLINVHRENIRRTVHFTRSANETSHRTGASPTHQSAWNISRETATPRAAVVSVPET